MLWVLGNTTGNLDIAGIVGSYIALFLAAFLCFFLFFGLDQLIAFIAPDGYSYNGFGFQPHFDAISRGVLDTKNLVYFISIILFFNYITTLSLKAYKR